MTRGRAWLFGVPALVAVAAVACGDGAREAASAPGLGADSGAGGIADAAGGPASGDDGGGRSGGMDAGRIDPTDGGATGVDVGPPPPDPCRLDGGCPPGTWVDVTPPSMVPTLSDHYGPAAVEVDPARPQDLYAPFPFHGIWKSTDYGQTWSGPINTGQNGSVVSDCTGYIRIPPTPKPGALTIYLSCIEGAGVGFWRSDNGGVDWTNHLVLPTGGQATPSNQGFYSPAIDPYDPDHLLMAEHAVDLLTESIDGGKTWTLVGRDPAMDGGSTYGINFIDTGDPATTRKTWLCMSAGSPGTWRTEDGGASWTQVHKNQHPAGISRIYQPGDKSKVYMAGEYSGEGDGVFLSEDYGKTWAHLGGNGPERVVIGTRQNLYAMYGWACGPGCDVFPNFENVAAPGKGTWSDFARPLGMTQGPAAAAVTNDGQHAIVVVAAYNAGLWRFVEP